MKSLLFLRIRTLIMRILLSVVCLGISFTNSAHQVHSATSTVLFNNHTNDIEVIHRFALHDVEHAVQQLFDENSDVINDSLVQENFVHYVVDRFVLGDKQGHPFELNLGGYELAGDHFVIYQKMAHPEELPAISIQHESLRDVWYQQQNHVTIEGKGNIKSHIFDGTLAQAIVHF